MYRRAPPLPRSQEPLATGMIGRSAPSERQRMVARPAGQLFLALTALGRAAELELAGDTEFRSRAGEQPFGGSRDVNGGRLGQQFPDRWIAEVELHVILERLQIDHIPGVTSIGAQE